VSADGFGRPPTNVGACGYAGDKLIKWSRDQAITVMT
jgi:hypothetical protein